MVDAKDAELYEAYLDGEGSDDAEDGEEVLPTAAEVEAKDRLREEARRERVKRVKEGVVGLLGR